MNHYPHHIGDFNNATRHLTRVERSLYRDMLELYYDTEQPLNSDPAKIARRVLASSDSEREALNLVLEEFFVLQDDGWHNTRCDAEIAKYKGQIEQASRAGKASAAKRYGKNLTTVERPFNQPEPEPEPIEAKASVASKLPTCPTEKLIESYQTILPELPGVRVIDKARKKLLKDRWEWVLTSTKPDGTRRAENEEQATEWFKSYFEMTRESDFLMGRTPRTNGHQNWQCDIDYLMTTKGLKQVIEKTKVAA